MCRLLPEVHGFLRLVSELHLVQKKPGTTAALVRPPTYLVFSMRFKEEDIDNRELVDLAVALEFLAYSCADGCGRQRDVIHGLDLGGLQKRLLAWIWADKSHRFGRQTETKRILFDRRCSCTKGRRENTYTTDPFAVGRQNSALGFCPVCGYLELISRENFSRIVVGTNTAPSS